MIRDEEIRFERVLTIGLKYLSQLEPGDSNVVPGERIFELHSERGFPADLAAEILHERGLIVGWTGYERAEREHQRLSRISMEKRFRQ